MTEIKTPITTEIIMYEASDGKQFSYKDDCLDHEKEIQDNMLFKKIFTSYDDNEIPNRIADLNKSGFGNYFFNFIGCFHGSKSDLEVFKKCIEKDYPNCILNFSCLNYHNSNLYIATETRRAVCEDDLDEITFKSFTKEEVIDLFDRKYDYLKEQLTEMDLIRIKETENERNI